MFARPDRNHFLPADRRNLESFNAITVRGDTMMIVKRPGAMVLNEGIGRRLLNVREAAQFLGLQVDTVYKKARLREVPCVKVGRALRFDLKALDRFIEQYTIETID